MELTEQDREQIQKQIAAIQSAQSKIPLAPDGQNAQQSFNQALTEASKPDLSEQIQVKKKMKKLWGFWRQTALDSKSLEIEKIACQIEIERAETAAKLAEIKRAEEIRKHQHWLDLNRGNLKDIGYNTESKPSMFWYNIKRAMFHIAKLTTDVPKIILNLFLIGFIILIIVILNNIGVI